MRQKLWIFFLFLSIVFSSYAQQQETVLKGTILNAETGQPIPKARILLKNQSKSTLSGWNGEFIINRPAAGNSQIIITANGYATAEFPLTIQALTVNNIGEVKLNPETPLGILDDNAAFVFTESQLNEDDDNDQGISALMSTNDDVFLSTASYNFSPVRFLIRGYDSRYTDSYVNGVKFNDAERGRFNFSLFGGLNDITRNREIANAYEPDFFGFGAIGGANNFNIRASQFAAGSKLTLSATNRNYVLRGMYTYSTGLLKNGWALTASVSRRWAHQGYIEGTFYNGWAYFVGVEKVFNSRHSLSLSTWGAPTQRGQQAASTQEAYDLAGSNFYNPNWGYQNGKKRNARVVESYEPTTLLSYEFKIDDRTRWVTGASFRYTNYETSALNWYNSADPRPDYYRYLPSYLEGTAREQAFQAWTTDKAHRQIDWDGLYRANAIAKMQGINSARYMVENRHNNQLAFNFSSVINKMVNNNVHLTGGLEFGTTKGMHYKKMDDLLGAEYFVDLDQFAERDFGANSANMQNDLDHPNRKIYVGDKFGYNYNIYVNSGNLWGQGIFKYNHWDFFYAAKTGATQFWRKGLMRNGRAPQNSKGNSSKSTFVESATKLGVTFKPTGNHIVNLNAGFENRAPLPMNTFVSPRIKNTLMPDLQTEKILSADLSYLFTFPYISGRITAYQTTFFDGLEVDNYYHDLAKTYVNQVMSGIKKIHRGIEAAVAVKATSSLTFSAVASIAEFRYKNRPTATLSYENGSRPDTTETVYIKNFYVGGTPQTAIGIGVDYSIKGWFFNANLNYYDRTYLDFNTIRRTEKVMAGVPYSFGEIIPTINQIREKAAEISRQEKLDHGFMLNIGIGKYLRFRNGQSLSLNLTVNNVINNTKFRTGGYEQNRFDFTDYNLNKFPSKYYYAQGINAFFSAGYRF